MAFKVIIVGGGLSGALLGNGLLNNGVDFTLFERDPQNSKREGYQIRLGDSSMIGFKSCLTDSHITTIKQKLGRSSGTSSTAPALYSSQWRLVLDLTALPFYDKTSAINRVTLRNLLIEPLAGAGRVKYGKTFSHYKIFNDPGGLEKVRVVFADGTEEVCDVLVGADGSGSIINEQVGARNLISIQSHKIFLAKGHLPDNEVAAMPKALLKGPTFTVTHKGNFFFALYLPSKETPAPKAVVDGDPNSLLEYDSNEVSFFWGLTVPADTVNDKKLDTKAERLQFCSEYVRDWAPEFQKLIATGDLEGNDLNMVPLRASSKLPRSWRAKLQNRKGGAIEEGHPRVWLMGDAAHAMLPNRGQGGNQAMQDCADILPPLLELNEAASDVKTPSTAQVDNARRRYEEKMIDRAFAWVKKSGGTSIGHIDLDGWFGSLVWVLGKLVVPIVGVFNRVFGADA